MPSSKNSQLMTATKLTVPCSVWLMKSWKKARYANLALIGVRRRGVPLANRIALAMGALTAWMYRRDAGHYPVSRRSLESRCSTHPAIERNPVSGG